MDGEGVKGHYYSEERDIDKIYRLRGELDEAMGHLWSLRLGCCEPSEEEMSRLFGRVVSLELEILGVGSSLKQ